MVKAGRTLPERFKTVTGPVLPLNPWIGNATGIQDRGSGEYQAAAEPVRNHGGSALAVRPAR
ncbi:MAG: hypothetical protein ABR571_15495 [Jatrophihabitans sp.]|uniref:hypothetical protein n=1 Tax=Jatrophihabitans sp. TaxID=1932789 RepID=UPI003912D79F